MTFEAYSTQRNIPAAGPCAPHTTPFPEEKSILGVIYGVLLWAFIVKEVHRINPDFFMQYI